MPTPTVSAFLTSPLLPSSRPLLRLTPYLPVQTVCSKQSPTTTAKPSRKPHRRPPPPIQTRLHPSIQRAPSHGPAASVRQTLNSRRDLLLLGPGFSAKLSAILSARERSEHALVLLPTHSEVERAAAEIDMDRRGSRLIVCAGHGGSNWAFPDINANSATKSVIVVGTPRAVAAKFCGSQHGRNWLEKVRFLVMVDVDGMLEVGCRKEAQRILKAMREKRFRKNTVVVVREPEGEVKTMVERLLRDKCGVVQWEGVAEGWVRVREEIKKEEIGRREIGKEVELKSRKQIVVAGSHRGVVGVLLKEVRTQMKKHGKRKVIVFFATARLAECYAGLGRAAGLKIIDLTTKSSTGKKIRELEAFYVEEKGIIFSSDVLTRDAILAEVDCVIQVGLPQTNERYRSRIALLGEGREAGEDRYAMLIISDIEKETVKHELKLGEGAEWREVGGEDEDWKPEGEGEGEGKIWNASGKRRGYESWLGYYRHCRKRLGWTITEMVEHGNDWAQQVLGEVPVLEKKVINRLFLRNVAGIRTLPPKK